MGLTLAALYVVGTIISASFNIADWSSGIRMLVSLAFLAVFSTVSILEYYNNKNHDNEHH